MRYLFFIIILASTVACGQTVPKNKPINKNNTPMSINTEQLSNPVVKAAIEALQAGDRNAWFNQFTADAALYDDGNKMNFKSFFDKAIGHERFTSINKVENEGKDIYGNFHSDQWGDFYTYFKFTLNSDNKISRLDIGQAK